ncbi:Bioproteinsis of lysosome- organelles complex 1 subunit 1 [Pleodorina starrii]|uniref:Biogenesis of lysosome-related organelles complex 1 subunit 1 n=1 Tax=Pleodorina starrii TaxID=330485 RepID=A0A9W6F5U0_9CHLO|nr:Bioproteinsis of lysosome- organelles complex 1 subunit 1 [Pleodorina starrii]GLC57359.1 Bioproteinsis of lysosome- organelles complex 1 subunit 1 [Pleodorina starrii]GLC71244.1 Bioproteinsis of lysosome- organelles complex 1 subunit 1 [Pleodorina starrii]
MLFSAAIREHERRKQQLQTLCDSETRAALGKVPQLASSLVDLANAEVSRIYELQLEIEREARGVRSEVAALERNLGEVAAAVRHVSDSLKQLGDFENYVLVLGERVERVTCALLQRHPPPPAQEDTATTTTTPATATTTTSTAAGTDPQQQ